MSSAGVDIKLGTSQPRGSHDHSSSDDAKHNSSSDEDQSTRPQKIENVAGHNINGIIDAHDSSDNEKTETERPRVVVHTHGSEGDGERVADDSEFVSYTVIEANRPDRFKTTVETQETQENRKQTTIGQDSNVSLDEGKTNIALSKRKDSSGSVSSSSSSSFEGVKRKPVKPLEEVDLNPDFSPPSNNNKQKETTDKGKDILDAAVPTSSEEEDDESEPLPAHLAPHDEVESPDRVHPADHHFTWHVDEPVQLYLPKDGPAVDEKPLSIPTFFTEITRNAPNVVALAVKRDGHWIKWTYSEYRQDVVAAAKAFIKLGLTQTGGVGILGFNAPEWHIAHLGAIFAGGISVGMYTTNNKEACHYVADHSTCNIIVVEDDIQLQKIMHVRHRLPHLKAIIQYTGTLSDKYPDVYTWQQFIMMGRAQPKEPVEQRLQCLAPNKCAILIYTSGTTGNPKGVMLSHDNITSNVRVARKESKMQHAKEVFIGFLPLSHVAAMFCDIHLVASVAATLYFAKPDALKGSLADTLREVQPTVFFVVPRLWEKMQEKMTLQLMAGSAFKRKIVAWANGVGVRGNQNTRNEEPRPFGWTIANALVFKKAKALLGFSRCRYMYNGAAPCNPDTLKFFLGYNIPICDVYGMSECSIHTINYPWKYILGSAGLRLPGHETMLINQDEDGNGEICMRGRHVFMGYLSNEEQTREAIDEEGWLHSGDIGRMDEKGFLHITGRQKEILITAGGENIAPVARENDVKEQLPCVSNCMLIGDARKFLSILLTLKTDVNLETLMPEDTLAPTTLSWCRALGCQTKTLQELLESRDPRVLRALQQGINRANDKAISQAQKIQKWTILPTDFSIPGGELGPTMKVKRPIVVKKYKNTIEAIYRST